ncbi:hypothetical protein E2C01_069870 [Portunus trituberculatus]|uniref:Uncharacterized protein n=1 Tax=Portunus trituberculatus TaxID=210409 RepID=A0A5B7HR67_PORTR|nr:hypothetical protein [Portunus trituberculatus]
MRNLRTQLSIYVAFESIVVCFYAYCTSNTTLHVDIVESTLLPVATLMRLHFDVWTLRHLDSLASLSLANNPISSQHYPTLVLAHLPRLAYLDHHRVTPQDHADALQLHRYSHYWCSRPVFTLVFFRSVITCFVA